MVSEHHFFALFDMRAACRVSLSFPFPLRIHRPGTTSPSWSPSGGENRGDYFFSDLVVSKAEIGCKILVHRYGVSNTVIHQKEKESCFLWPSM